MSIPKIPTAEEHWKAWLDFSCVCGFPHPKPGKFGPPPEIVEIPGIGPVRYPHYSGVMGGDHPVNES